MVVAWHGMAWRGDDVALSEKDKCLSATEENKTIAIAFYLFCSHIFWQMGIGSQPQTPTQVAKLNLTMSLNFMRAMSAT